MTDKLAAALRAAETALLVYGHAVESGMADSDLKSAYTNAEQVLDRIDAALAEHDAAPPQPVAWMDDFGNTFPLIANKGAGSWRDEHKRDWKPLYAAPPAQPDYCTTCGGSGTVPGIAGAGPDAYNVDVPCHACGGTGDAAPVARPARCQRCGGSLQATGRSDMTGECTCAAQPVALTDEACSKCHGEGTVRSMTTGHGPDDYEFDEQCPACNGTGSGDIRDAINALGFWNRADIQKTLVERDAVLRIIEARAILAAGKQP
jgi:hypothetical protein